MAHPIFICSLLLKDLNFNSYLLTLHPVEDIALRFCNALMSYKYVPLALRIRNVMSRVSCEKWLYWSVILDSTVQFSILDHS